MLVAACSGPARQGGTTEVDFLWVKRARPGRAWQGGSSRALVKVEKSDSGMHVGVFESKPGGTGDLWRAATWIAAVTGTLTVFKNPQDYRFTIETETLSGRVDGPSAGGLFAVAVMAALSGDAFDPAATMTGTVNPDGTVGPVGGLVQKVKAAGKAGKRRFCYPAGQRQEKDELTGETLDIVLLAEELGVEAVEVEDLRQAYVCLVRKKLERTKPARLGQMALSGDTFELVRKNTESWLTKASEAYVTSRKLSEVERFEPLWKKAMEEYEAARALLKDGLVAAAYRKAALSYVESRAILLTAAMADRLSEGDQMEALKIFSAIEEDADRQVDEVFAALTQEAPENVGSAIALLDAYEAAITSVVSRDFARARYVEVLRKMKEALRKGETSGKMVSLFDQLRAPLRELAWVEVNVRRALDSLELMEAQNGGDSTRLLRIEEVALVFQGAASANIEYFDATIVKEMAEQARKPMEAAIAMLLQEEPNYRTAQYNLKLPESGQMGYAATGLPLSLAKLAGALSSFFASSALVAKFHSIGVKLDSSGNAVAVEREQALTTTLGLAEEKARENAALALEHAGAIPESACIAYQIGVVLTNGSNCQDRLDALEYFWRSSTWSQVAVYLAMLERHAKQ